MGTPNLNDSINEFMDFVQSSKVKKEKKLTPEQAKLLGKPQADPVMTDQEIRDNPPEPTGYDSSEGTRIYNGKKYKHNELMPNGEKANCPKLNDDEWANLFEQFPFFYTVPNADGILEEFMEYRPAHLSELDLKFMGWLNKYQRVLIKAYRDARKSSNLQRKVKRLILDKHQSGVYYSSTTRKAKQFSQKIREQLKNNANILRYYGYVIDKDQGDRKEELFFKWQQGGANRDPGLSIASIEGSSAMGLHPDWIAIDDVCEEKVAGSDIKLETLIEWFTKQVVPMVTPTTKMFVVGTPKDPHDVYAYIEETKMYKVETLPAILIWPNGNQQKPGLQSDGSRWYYVEKQFSVGDKPIICGVGNLQGGLVSFNLYFQESWHNPGRIQYYLEDDPKNGLDHNRMAMQELLLRLKEMGRASFDSEMQMQTVKVGEGFLRFDELIQYFNPNTWEGIGQLQQCAVAMYDQAFGNSATADNNCVVICAKHDENLFILDAYLWKCALGGFLDKAQNLLRIFQQHPYLRTFGVEAGLMNSADWTNIQNTLQEYNIPFEPIYQNNYTTTRDEEEGKQKLANFEFDASLNIKASKKGKIQRIINQWSPRLSARRIFISELLDPEVMDEFNNEKTFPKCSKFDFIDACGSALDLADRQSEDMMVFAFHGGSIY